MEDDRVRAYGVWGKGEIIGSSISPGFDYIYESLTDVIVEPIPPREVNYLPVLSRYIFQLEEVVAILSERQVKAKLFRLFQWLLTMAPPEQDSAKRIPIPLTHQDIADLIGASREAVTRELRLLEERNDIDYVDKLISVKADLPIRKSKSKKISAYKPSIPIS